MRPQPPQWIFRLISWYCHPMYTNEITGDLQELFELWVSEKGLHKAKWYYAWNAFLFIRIYNSRFSQNSKNMNRFSHFAHHLKFSWRNLLRYRVFHLSNILGLAFGLGVSYLIFIHVDRELSYEKHITHHQDIYRISTHQEWAKSSPILREKLEFFFPEFQAVGRVARYGSGTMILSSGEKQITASDLFQADTTIIDMFDIKIVEGTTSEPLHRPFTAMISRTMANKLFENKSAIGEVFQINDQQEFEITAIYEDLPGTSHLKADALISMHTFYANLPEDWYTSPGWMVMYTYVQTMPDSPQKSFTSRMVEFQEYYYAEAGWGEIEENFFEVMPLGDIHLKSHRIQEMGENSDMTYVIIFGSLALFILIIAAVNFVNIFTAIGLRRVREIGVRKLVGATRPNLITQLLTESIMSSVIASCLAMVIGLSLLPWYNQSVSLGIASNILWQLPNLLCLFSVSIGLGILSGLYPALFITARDPISAVARNEQPRSAISYFRKGLIVLQFALSLFVFVGGVVILEQLRFIEAQDLGYDQENVLAIKTYGELRESFHTQSGQVKSRIKSIPGVVEVGRSSNLVGESLSYEGFELVDRPGELDGSINMFWTDETFRATMNVDLLEGKDFHKMDSGIAFLVNQSMAEALGGDVIGKFANWRDESGPILGVIKDFHHYSLKSAVEPTVLAYKPEWASQWLVKLEGSTVRRSVTDLESLVKEIAPNSFFIADFIDERIDRLYEGEQNMLGLVGILTSLALVISCVGLLGVASVEIRRRIKEISIRKVLGASSFHVLRILGFQFAIMAVIAMSISIPASFWFGHTWLSNFSLQMNLTWWIFTLPTLLVCTIILLVVCTQAVPLLRRNPGLVLRKE